MLQYSFTITSHHRCDLNFGFNQIGKNLAIGYSGKTANELRGWLVLLHYQIFHTLTGLQTNVVFLVDVSQHKRAGVINKMIWIYGYITVKTANYTNRSFVAVCCGTKNQVIAPCAILFHASQVISPR